MKETEESKARNQTAKPTTLVDEIPEAELEGMTEDEIRLLRRKQKLEAEAAERQRVQERQRAQRLKDKAACERYKEQWSHDQGWRIMSMARQKEAMKKLTETNLKHSREARQRQKGEAKTQERAAWRTDSIRKFLEDEGRNTVRACDRRKRGAERLLRNRGLVLHDAMVKAIEQSEQAHMQQVLRGILRALRLPMLSRRSITLLNRARLRNWCRICARYKYLWRAMPVYRKLRTQWVIWNKWLRFLDARFMRETPKLSEKVKHKRILVHRLTDELELHGVDINSNEEEVRTVQSSLKGIFFRWVEMTQLNACLRQMVQCSLTRRESRLMQRVFHGWRTLLPAKNTYPARLKKPPFVEQRCLADLDKLKIRLLRFAHNLPTHRLRKMWHLRRKCVARKARAELTLKHILHEQRGQVAKRQSLERTLLLQAFDLRGQSEYHDFIDGPAGGAGGEIFSDTGMPPHTHVEQVIIHCSDVVEGVALVAKAGATTLRTPFRGSNHGKRCVFEVGEEEMVVALEGLAGRRVNRLRVHCIGPNGPRVSKWYGDVEMGGRFMLGGDSEAGDVVVGFCGRANPNSLIALGVVIRHTSEVNVFSDCWLAAETVLDMEDKGNDTSSSQSASAPAAPPKKKEKRHGKPPETSASAALAEEQFAHILRMRACDIEVALSRSQKLAKSMWRTPDDPYYAEAMAKARHHGRRKKRGEKAPVIQKHSHTGGVGRLPSAQDTPGGIAKLEMISTVSRWLFEGLSRGLVHLEKEPGKGVKMIETGIALVHRGEHNIEKGTKTLEEIDGYDPAGNHRINVGQLGTSKVKDLMAQIEGGEGLKEGGEAMVKQGEQMKLDGKALLPAIAQTPHMLSYFHKLYKLSQTASTLKSVGLGSE